LYLYTNVVGSNKLLISELQSKFDAEPFLILIQVQLYPRH